jgi:hypothetical protein
MSDLQSFAGAKGGCSGRDQIRCEGANSANDCSKGTKDYCKENNCEQSFAGVCGKRRQLRQLSKKVKTDLNGTDFSETLSKYTGFDIIEAGVILEDKKAPLNSTSLKSIAICTIARYNYTQQEGKPGDPWFIDCKDYQNASCQFNDYTYLGSKEGFCGDSTEGHTYDNETSIPTWSPTFSPTYSPPTSSNAPSTIIPTYFPTSSPTYDNAPTSVCYKTGDQRDNSRRLARD